MIKIFIFSKKNKRNIYKYLDKLNELNLNLNIDEILKNIKNKKDKAIIEYTKKFDGVKIKNLKVSKKEIKDAYKNVEKKYLKSIKIAKKNIENFHKMQIKNIKGYIFKNKGYKIIQKYLPIESVGLYIPGGQTPLVSTVLMAGIPAKIAGVKRIVIVSPPRYKGTINPYILVTADLLGINEIYKVGGAQAIAALSYGTETIPKVDKVVGPGNIFSTIAKKKLFGVIGIDSISGPSEITILADDTAKEEFIIYDLLAQAEHINGHSLLITDSKKLAKIVYNELKNIKNLNLSIIVVKNILNEGVDIVNYKGPEHLQIIVKNYKDILKKIKNAPAIFVGNYSPVAFGDYIAGANHILPTNGTSKFLSALSILDFLKHTHIVFCKKEGIKNYGRYGEDLAELEKLNYHKESLKIRREK